MDVCEQFGCFLCRRSWKLLMIAVLSILVFHLAAAGQTVPPNNQITGPGMAKIWPMPTGVPGQPATNPNPFNRPNPYPPAQYSPLTGPQNFYQYQATLEQQRRRAAYELSLRRQQQLQKSLQAQRSQLAVATQGIEQELAQIGSPGELKRKLEERWEEIFKPALESVTPLSTRGLRRIRVSRQGIFLGRILEHLDSHRVRIEILNPDWTSEEKIIDLADVRSIEMLSAEEKKLLVEDYQQAAASRRAEGDPQYQQLATQYRRYMAYVQARQQYAAQQQMLDSMVSESNTALKELAPISPAQQERPVSPSPTFSPPARNPTPTRPPLSGRRGATPPR